MGIYDRDYMRHDRTTDPEPIGATPPGFWLWAGVSVLVILLISVGVHRRASEYDKQIAEAAIVPNRPPEPMMLPRPNPIVTTHEPLNINTASLEEIDALPQVSAMIAQSIIDNRPYYSVDQLTRAWGIGPKRLSLLRRYVTVGAAPTNGTFGRQAENRDTMVGEISSQ